MPEDVQSRFTVYERPEASPGKCIVCGAVDRPVVDFGVDVDLAPPLGFGRAYFCVTCVTQAASKFPQNQTPAAVPEFTEAQFNDWKEDVLNSLAGTLSEFRIDGGFFVPVYGTADSVPEQTDPDDITELQSDKPESSEPDRETDEPVKLEGPPRIPITSSGGLFDGLFDARL